MNDLLLAYVCSFANAQRLSEGDEAMGESFEGLCSWGDDLLHDDSGTRDAAAEALLHMGNEAISSLRELLDDPDERIRTLAESVLSELEDVVPGQA